MYRNVFKTLFGAFAKVNNSFIEMVFPESINFSKPLKFQTAKVDKFVK